MLRPIASPLAVGFIGLAMATIAVTALQLGWVPPSEQPVVAIALLAFVVPTQAIASVFGFLARDGIAATGMGVLAGTWGMVGWVLATSAPGSTSDALGIALLVSATAMLIPASAAFTSKLVPALVLTTAAARFAVTGVYQVTGAAAWKQAAGWVGLALGVLAVYAAWATQLEDVLGRSVLPTARRAKGRAAIEGTLTDQVADVHHEAGVRHQL